MCFLELMLIMLSDISFVVALLVNSTLGLALGVCSIVTSLVCFICPLDSCYLLPSEAFIKHACKLMSHPIHHL